MNITKITDNPTIFPMILLAIVFVSLGFIQIVFQQDIRKAVDETRQTQGIINQTLVKMINEPQGNFTAQAEAIKKIEANVESLERIEQKLNITSKVLNGSISDLDNNTTGNVTQ